MSDGPPAPGRGHAWLGGLARMGRLSYELYLTHMFVVLAVVAGYRALLGPSQAWTFVVYLPAVALCVGLAVRVERFMRVLADRPLLAPFMRPGRAPGIAPSSAATPAATGSDLGRPAPSDTPRSSPGR